MIPSNSLSISIRQQNARIGFDISRPVLEIQQPAPELQLEQHQPQMQIDQGTGTLSIDGEDVHSALGHKPTLRMITEIADQVRQIVLDAIGDISSEGDQLMSIDKGTKIVDIIEQRMNKGPMPIEDTGPFSFSPMHVAFEARPTRIEWTPGTVHVHATTHDPEIHYVPGKVDVYLAQKNWVEIGVTGTYLNMQF